MLATETGVYGELAVISRERERNARKTSGARTAMARRGSILAAAIIGLLIPPPAPSAAVNVPPNTNLFIYTPSAGDIWNLGGNAYLSNGVNPSYYKAVPPGTPTTPGLTINGNGFVVTLNDGVGRYGGFGSLTTVNMSLSDVTLTGGNNTSYAGTIFTNSGNLSLTTSGNVVFLNNRSPSGGALFARNGSVIIIGGATFNANNAVSPTGYGGAVYSDQNISFANSGAASVVVTNNTAVAGGAGLNAGNSVTTTGDTVLSQNSAGTNGGGVRTVLGDVALATQSGNVVVTSNKAGTAGAGNGGGIYAVGGASLGNTSGDVFVGGSDTSAGNSARSGGGIYATGPVNLTGRSLTLSNNVALLSGGGIYSGQAVNVTGPLTATSNVASGGNGGAIYSQSGNVSIHGSVSASGNRTLTAGGVIYTNAGDITITETSTLNANIAAAGTGGALRANGGNVNVATTSGDVALTDNTAFSNGGAIFAAGTGSGNVSVGNAGATVILTGNRAGFNADGSIGGAATAGGAINASSGATSIMGRTVNLSNNISNGTSGGVFSARDVTVSGDLTANGNQALSGSAGALRAVTGDVTVNGGLSMDRNVAGGGVAGAVYAANGSVSLATTGGDVALTHNTATSNGGAVTALGVGNISIGIANSRSTYLGIALDTPQAGLWQAL